MLKIEQPVQYLRRLSVNTKKFAEAKNAASNQLYFSKGKVFAQNVYKLPNWLSEALVDVRSALIFLTKNNTKHNAFINGLNEGFKTVENSSVKELDVLNVHA